MDGQTIWMMWHFGAAMLLLSTSAAAAQRQSYVVDGRFLAEAGAGGLAELEAGKLAQKRAYYPELRRFCEQIVQEHGRANDELKSLAEGKGILVPATPMPQQQRDLQQLAACSGSDFDRACMRLMLVERRKTIDLFDKQAQVGSDPDVKAFVVRMLPVLKHRLFVAETTERALGKDGASRS